MCHYFDVTRLLAHFFLPSKKEVSSYKSIVKKKILIHHYSLQISIFDWPSHITKLSHVIKISAMKFGLKYNLKFTNVNSALDNAMTNVPFIRAACTHPPYHYTTRNNARKIWY